MYSQSTLIISGKRYGIIMLATTQFRCHLACIRDAKQFGTRDKPMDHLDHLIERYRAHYPPADRKEGEAFLPSILTDDELVAAEDAIKLRFPTQFRGALSRFSFRRGDIGFVEFAIGERLEQLLEMNACDDRSWSQQGSLPPKLFVAHTDG